MDEKKTLVFGIIAHVDAGKTTLSESMLYVSGSIRELGRVDHQNAFLDTFEMERARGITIFSKQAVFSWKNIDINLLDTPGHVDFSAEMERTLQVLDYAILVISGPDGVQGHTETLWRLFREYKIPVFLFVNKMDQDGADLEKILEDLKKRLDENCLNFSWQGEGQFPPYISAGQLERLEQVALCSESLMEEYLETGKISLNSITKAIQKRTLFPCYFGSALRVEGVAEFLDGLGTFAKPSSYPSEFGAKVYKIARDEQGSRLTYLKVTGGVLRVKDALSDEEKVNQIRIYSGAKYEAVQEVGAGQVCAIIGLSSTYPGQGLGKESASPMMILEPVLTYQILLPEGVDAHKILPNLRLLEEEEPQLRITWQEQLGELHAQLMGEVQIEILKTLIYERFGVEVEFGPGNILYRETIAEPVEGIGHFEPLRHYAEVHLLLEPAEQGTGLEFATNCSEDILDGKWQRLVLSHLEEKEHLGVLTGSPITDMKITLITGRAHIKHTEGGDFRQATYRAVRQGLKKAKSMLLEPFYEFSLEVPNSQVGRAMSDIQRMYGSFDAPGLSGDTSILTGAAPVSTMRGYQTELLSYTGGRGRLTCNLKGYAPCHNQDEVVEAMAYDSEGDLANPTGSVFCSHGAGFPVRWDEVEGYMHLESNLFPKVQKEQEEMQLDKPLRRASYSNIELTQKELDAIYVRTPLHRYQPPVQASPKSSDSYNSSKGWSKKKDKEQEEYLLVDGYNIIFAWEELQALAEINIESARNKLMDILSNYQGYKGCTLILVFDAYKVEGNPGSVIKYHNIHVVYTKEAETADQYIEKTVAQIGRKYHVTVATSDALEQMIILGQGAYRLSAAGLRGDVEATILEMRKEHLNDKDIDKNYLFDHLDEDLAQEMESVRLGMKSEI